MNLDNLTQFKQTDTSDMLKHVEALPEQLSGAWQNAQEQALDPALGKDLRQIVICGMGGSAISGDLLRALVADTLTVPVMVSRGYGLPAYAYGPETLVITLSHSGGTEETLSAAQTAIERRARLMAITTGGTLATLVEEAGGAVLRYAYDSPPRAALGWLYGSLLGGMQHLGLIDVDEAIQETLDLLRKTRETITPTIKASLNPAKRTAGQMMGRIPVMWGGGVLEPVARRWKTQINENAKVPAYYEEMPELCHNSVVGTEVPRKALEQMIIVQLVARRHDHPRVVIRQKATTKLLLQEAIFVDRVSAAGQSPLASQLSLAQLGDYVSYYLAMGYQMDPTPIPQIDMLKEELAKNK